jgi:uncharacterized protein
MDHRIAELLVCPSCHAKLLWAHRDPTAPQQVTDLVCKPERLAYPLRNGMPILLREEAATLAADDPVLS